VSNALLARSGTNLTSHARTATTTAGGGGFAVFAWAGPSYFSAGAGLTASGEGETFGSSLRRRRA
jgi:hypothetical protein